LALDRKETANAESAKTSEEATESNDETLRMRVPEQKEAGTIAEGNLRLVIGEA
jgi:hypothetical protein